MSRGGVVYVVDDDHVVRASLAMLIETAGVEVRSYGSSREFLEDPHRDDCDCLVLDLRMPGMSGLELQSRLGSGFTAPIIFVSGHADVPTAVQAMRDGAVDFLQKPFSDQALLDRVALALERSRVRRMEAERQAALRARLALLTPRELEVMRLVVVGRMTKLIADKLQISVKTVEDHRAAVMKKMRAGSVAELVRMVGESDDMAPGNST